MEVFARRRSNGSLSERESYAKACVRRRLWVLWLLHCGWKRGQAAKVVGVTNADLLDQRSQPQRVVRRRNEVFQSRSERLPPHRQPLVPRRAIPLAETMRSLAIQPTVLDRHCVAASSDEQLAGGFCCARPPPADARLCPRRARPIRRRAIAARTCETRIARYRRRKTAVSVAERSDSPRISKSGRRNAERIRRPRINHLGPNRAAVPGRTRRAS